MDNSLKFIIAYKKLRSHKCSNLPSPWQYIISTGLTLHMWTYSDTQQYDKYRKVVISQIATRVCQSVFVCHKKKGCLFCSKQWKSFLKIHRAVLLETLADFQPVKKFPAFRRSHIQSSPSLFPTLTQINGVQVTVTYILYMYRDLCCYRLNNFWLTN